MSVVRVETDPPYDVRVGPGRLAEAGGSTGLFDAVCVLADARVAELHGARLTGLHDAPQLALEAGEAAKSLGRLGEVLEFLAAAGLSRDSCLIAFGGGTIGDLGGLAASLYKRGIAVVQAPTTLLAQVDASVGGKTAINLSAGKNLAGTFHQPSAVLADTAVLSTLPDGELRSGLGEVVKTGLVGGDELFATIEARAPALVARDPDALGEVVAGCVAAKARVVAEDPTERGPRRALNLGHTFAHGIEHAAGYGTVPHGVAVAAGIALAFDASRELGLLDDDGLRDRTLALLATLGLPTNLAELRSTYGVELARDSLVAGIAHDKKGRVGRPEFVLPGRAGALELGVPLKPELLEALLE